MKNRAFTLIEVVVSCAIVSIILLATQSALVVLVKTTPDGKTGPSARLAAAKAMDVMAGDFRWATSITKDTSTEIIFLVPDRTGDGVAETIRYVWSGVAGSPLYRQMNGGGSVSISDNVQAFSLMYDTGTVSIAGATTTSPETQLASYVGPAAPAPTGTNIDSSNGVGEYFIPALPSNALTWNVTRILVYAQGVQSPSKAVATLFTSSCELPDTAISTYQTPQLSSTYSWVQFPLVANNLDPHVGLCFQVLGTNSKQTVAIETQNPGPSFNPGPCVLLKTSDGGNTWTAPANQSMLFYAYGTYVTPGTPVAQVVLNEIRCTLQAGADPATQVVTSVRIPNSPVLP